MLERRRFWIIGSLLVIHTALLAYSAYVHSPVVSEVPHLPAGISHWELGRFDLYRVNPPLVRMVGVIPVLMLTPETDWSRYAANPRVRSETVVGEDFVQANKDRACWLYTVGRWGCIPFSLLGAVVCYKWANALYGVASGLTAITLWCFCPNILGNAALLMPDVPAAALGLTAWYLFWRWLQEPTWKLAISTGVVLGLAELTKTTLLLLYPLWIAVALIRRSSLQMVIAQIAISIAAINVGYAFEDSCQLLGNYRFESSLFKRLPSCRWLPVPLPANYVEGIDTQLHDFDQGMTSYLRGEWSTHGWWWFYLYGLAIKLPLGVWGLAAAAAITKTSADDCFLLAPALAILFVVSYQTGFSIHFRYLLPAFGFGFIWASKALIRYRWTGILIAWPVISSLYFYPHSLSYFNELVGPGNGGQHLLGSSISWGQDLRYLNEWIAAHPEARPVHVALPAAFPELVVSGEDAFMRLGLGRSPAPSGWYAIDVNCLYGAPYLGPGGEHLTIEWPSFLRHSQLRARIGYSTYIYYIDGNLRP